MNVNVFIDPDDDSSEEIDVEVVDEVVSSEDEGSYECYFNFKVPDEAPVFEPSNVEFEDPLVYIDKIRPIAIHYGICKIKPPPEWQPPFAVDIDNFKFTPRIQRINELEANTRIRLNFLDQIAKFWELQGSPLKIPIVQKKVVDLYSLHKIVLEEGGHFTVTKDKKWNKVVARLGMRVEKGIGIALKTHYEKILYPYDVFQSNELRKEKKDVPNKRLKVGVSSKNICGNVKKQNGFKNNKKKSTEVDPLAKYICLYCERGDVEEAMLLCDGCDDSYHTFCLKPPLSSIPKGDWRCPKCLAEEVCKPVEAFGFDQAEREYTLQEFGDMADKFKSEHFHRPLHDLSSEVVEKEYWRIVSSLEEDIIVEYGADLHSVEHGSGFPTKDSPNTTGDPQFQLYVESPWNLNNLPVLDGSVLRFIGDDISGMKIPWMYVGMCFSTFCWHNEDHWSYSINYLHWGEPKTWYGVPGSSAEFFEETMRSAAPELFENQPDLLHQLTTILNPNVLMASGVPVYRTDQQAGEFVITFPRAYHAGFNQGYNFAEAVNFAPPEWISLGRRCINEYSIYRRYCVFSHDELICKMANQIEKVDSKAAAVLYNDLVEMSNSERKLRKSLLQWGIIQAERVIFENLPDDERQCEICKTTCYLSCVKCRCETGRLACLNHYRDLCDCPPKKHIFRYNYSLDELPPLIQKVKLKALSFDIWIEKVTKLLEESYDTNDFDFYQMKMLLLEAQEKQFPDSGVLKSLVNKLKFLGVVSPTKVKTENPRTSCFNLQARLERMTKPLM